ncbi:MAG: IscS subfamily cysteine desulfurase [Ignavibacteria bacterium]|nr:IscS subfamily cysteine desulfurase [Ignavibacteria bacterium]
MKLPIYLDYNATTPVDPRVLDEMIPYFCSAFGNASSSNHKYGWEAEQAVAVARKRTADLIGAIPRDIVFTSGSTEAINISLKGIAETYSEKGNHIITCTTEHKAVLETCKYLEDRGFEVTYLEVDGDGLIDTNELEKAITNKTILVSIMLANNEIGTIQPVEEIGKICRENSVLFHTDATQAVGKIPVNVDEMNIDLMSISAHKFYGPKGSGALYVRGRNPRVTFSKQTHGGSQEKGLRGGTLNVPGIVGLGKACELSADEMENEIELHVRKRDSLIQKVLKLENATLNGHPTKRLPNNINFCFSMIDINALIGDLNDLAMSTGSACTSASMEPSHVLTAIGRPHELAGSSLRLSFGRFTKEEEIDYASERLVTAVPRLLQESPQSIISKSKSN